MTQRNRRANPPARMAPITESEYELIVQTAQDARPWEKPERAALRAAVDIAAIGLMRDGLLRLREAADARWSQLHRVEDGSGRLTIYVSKADRGSVLYVSPGTMHRLDEMHRIRRETGKDETDDRIFQMGSRQLSRHIRNACSSAGLVGRYGGSSPRIGMIMDLVRSGTSILDVMQAGRWKQPAVPAGFVRNITGGRGAVGQWYDRNRNLAASL